MRWCWWHTSGIPVSLWFKESQIWNNYRSWWMSSTFTVTAQRTSMISFTMSKSVCWFSSFSWISNDNSSHLKKINITRKIVKAHKRCAFRCVVAYWSVTLGLSSPGFGSSWGCCAMFLWEMQCAHNAFFSTQVYINLSSLYCKHRFNCWHEEDHMSLIFFFVLRWHVLCTVHHW